MKSIEITAFKVNCSSLLDHVARTGEPLIVTKHGKPFVRIGATGTQRVYPPSTLAGTVTVLGDIVTFDTRTGDSRVERPTS
jgi:antitoxin (DNA-binding transcriptional repressor) of toxin-antitoxin stability system